MLWMCVDIFVHKISGILCILYFLTFIENSVISIVCTECPSQPIPFGLVVMRGCWMSVLQIRDGDEPCVHDKQRWHISLREIRIKFVGMGHGVEGVVEIWKTTLWPHSCKIYREKVMVWIWGLRANIWVRVVMVCLVVYFYHGIDARWFDTSISWIYTNRNQKINLRFTYHQEPCRSDTFRDIDEGAQNH